MDNLIKDTATLELFCWLEPGAELPGWDILKGSPFGSTLASPEGGGPTPGDQLITVQNYFAEYHLEYFRQRRYNHFPSRLHALLLFATRTDAMTFRTQTSAAGVCQKSGLRQNQRALHLFLSRRHLARLPAPAAQPVAQRSG
jgi:hypothetical protein